MTNRTSLPMFLVLILAVAVVGLAQQQKPRAVFQPITDNPNLPRVLIIGDSISIGYTLPLREALKGVANVHRPPENCASTQRGLEKIDAWLGDGKWEVIHFNWGLHDLKYVDEKGHLALPPQGKRVTPPEQYAKNLEALVKRLKQTGATLVWRPTTPVPKGAAGRIPGDAYKYNQIALRIIKKHNIPVGDLNGLIRSTPVPHSKPDNVHFTAEGYRQLARRIAQTIEAVL